MNYQHVHGINQLIPNYVTKSDYLPTRVVEGANNQTVHVVPHFSMIAPSV